MDNKLTMFLSAVIMQIRDGLQSRSYTTLQVVGGSSIASTKCQLVVYLPSGVYLNTSGHFEASSIVVPLSRRSAYAAPSGVKYRSASSPTVLWPRFPHPRAKD